MLYLEDYLEMIKDLPQELRDRFTEMRELDLQVHNSTDRLEEKVKMLFSNAKKMKLSERDEEYESIRKEYYKTLEDGDEKVQLANQIYDLVDRHLRRLDQELHKFKMELEADNAGITEILERRSLELDQPNGLDSQKENRFSGVMSRPLQERNHTVLAQQTQITTSVKKEDRIEGRLSSVTPPLPANVAYSLGHIGAGSNAIAAAASQAIAATQQMQQGRRTASMKASYDAISAGVHTQEFSIGKELAGAAQTAVAATGMSQTSEKKQKSRKSVSAALSVVTAPLPMAIDTSPTPSEELVGDNIIDPNGDNPDWTYDPNEPRYCLCNQVSYGDMVACDNPTCPLEWFHYPCVGITAPPRGKWFCPQCAASMKRRARK